MNKHLYRLFALSAVVVVVLMTTACSRRCHCYGRDGSHRYFTEEELQAKGMKCSNMVTDGRGLLYSLCEYDLSNY